jgi:hypothetical protein
MDAILLLLGSLGLPLALLDLAEGGVAGGGADLGLLGALLSDGLLREGDGERSARGSSRAIRRWGRLFFVSSLSL